MGLRTTGAGGAGAADAVPPDPVVAALDGATRDSAVSGDAMRWSPELAATSPGLPAGGPAVPPEDAAVRRLVCGALYALPRGAERPQLTTGPGEQPPEE